MNKQIKYSYNHRGLAGYSHYLFSEHPNFSVEVVADINSIFNYTSFTGEP